jgi:Tfp pilus assembly protein PilF
MKKFLIAVLAVFLTGSVVKAQSLANGVNDIYAERYQSAKATFEKLLAANPNDIQATYWLGQAYIGMEDINGAKTVYDKGLTTSANAPLLLAGLGQVELIQNKINEARQHFETAITMSSGKKGSDPEILNAVGRGIADVYTDKDRKGDINYAVQKLQEASQAKTKDNALLADIHVNLGEAYLKARPGENGGQAFSSYQKAIEFNPNFALAYYRMAQLFKTQHNWDLFEKYLIDAITKDPRFAPAYYELAYFKLGKDMTAAENYARLFAENSDPNPQNEYLRASLLWVKKDYDQAISLSKSIVSRLGDKTRANVYKLLAYSYLDKKDSAGARQYIDEYFTKAKSEEVIALDYKLKADIYSAIPGQESVVFSSYLEGVKADTVLENKIELLKKGAEFFRTKALKEPNDSLKARLRVNEGELLAVLLQVKPNFTINEMFDTGRAFYFGQAYTKSRDIFLKFQEKYPNEVYGFEWAFNNSRVIDTVAVDSIAAPDAIKLVQFSEKDTAKFKKQYISAASFLAVYYANKAKDKEKAIEYLKKWQLVDPANKENIQKNIDILSKAGNGQPRSSTKASEANKTTSG